jgi:hypothetical protein
MSIKLSDLLAAIAGLDNASELKGFLTTYLADKDKEISQLEARVTTADTRLKTIASTLGVAEADVETTVKTLKKSATELEGAKTTNETLQTQNTELATKVKDLERRDKLTEFARVVGADRGVLIDLLPQDVEFEVGSEDKDGKTRRVGYIVGEKGKKIEFAEYVDGSDRLSRYKPAIFTQENNPPQTIPKLPTGKGGSEERPVVDKVVEDYTNKYRKPALDRIKQRFGQA